MDTRACLVAALVAAAALAAGAQPAGPRVSAALRSPGWAVFAPPPPPPLPTLANLYTILNGRIVAPVYLTAFHHNLLHLQTDVPKPPIFAKISAQSPVKSFTVQPPLFIQTLPRQSSVFEPYSFPTNRPPPATSTEAPDTTVAATTAAPATTPSPPPPPPTPPAPPPAQGKPTLLILKPYAKAVAGINGTAVATPLGHAVFRKGQPVDVLFDPRAVAVAGPGGHARAHSDLIVSYIQEEGEQE